MQKDEKKVAESKEIVETGTWINCHICEVVLGQKRETHVYCANCGRGMCREHGTASPKRPVPMCLYCGMPKSEKEKLLPASKCI